MEYFWNIAIRTRETRELSDLFLISVHLVHGRYIARRADYWRGSRNNNRRAMSAREKDGRSVRRYLLVSWRAPPGGGRSCRCLPPQRATTGSKITSETRITVCPAQIPA